MTKLMFHGSAAWVGGIHGPTTCDWWPRDPAQLKWDRSLLRTIDLAMTPSAALAGRIAVAQIEVDDHTMNGGRTTIGPLWPGGASIGACWVSENYLAKLGSTPSPPAAGGGHDYESMTIHYFDGEQQNRRFNGYHAVLRQVKAPLSLVEIWNPGTGAGGAKAAGTWWLDLNAVADPNTPPLVPGKPGALFLEARAASQISLFDGKTPPYRGGFASPPPAP
jgi:hypothetical protein